MALIRYRRTSMSSTRPRKKKSRSQLWMYSGLYLKMKKLARKAASPRANITRSKTGYLNSPFQVAMMGQMMSMIITQCRQISTWQQLYSPNKAPVAMSRRQSKNQIHFRQMGVSSVWMHLQPISWMNGKRKQKPAMAAAYISLVESSLFWFKARSTAVAKKYEEQQAQGKQIHLKNPLKAKQTAQNSTFLLPPHRCRPIKMANSRRSPIKTHPNES